MAYSYNETGATSPGQTLSVPFKFLERNHVRVLVDGVATTNYTWLNDGMLQASAGFPSGAKTRVERNTPVALLKAVLAGTAVFDWDGVNNNFFLILYVLQEYVDKEVVRNAQIEQIFDGFDRVEVAVQEAKDAAARAADDAAAGALAALEAVIAEIRQTALNAQAAADNANLAAGRAATEAAEAVADVLRQAMEATERAIAEAQKATEAADRASQFDPNGFYTKTAADAKFLTSLTAQNDFYTKAYITANYYTQTAINSALASRDTAIGTKYPISGGQIKGNVEIALAYPTQKLHYPGVRVWYTQVLNNGAFRIVDESANAERFSIGTDGVLRGSGSWTLNTNGDIHGSAFGGWLTTWVEGRAGAQGQAWANDRVANLQYRLVSLGEYQFPFAGGSGNQTNDAPGGAVIVGFRRDSNSAQYARYRYPQVYDPVRGWVGFGNA